ncbi:MAG: sulfotransferase [Planctomycetota bacterium]
MAPEWTQSNPIARQALYIARTCKYARMRREARRDARRAPDPARILPVRFVVGCGRSGTTILSHSLGTHPDAKFLYEPYHSWERIDTRADMTAFHSRPENKKIFFDAEDFEPEHSTRFRRLIASAGDPATHSCVVEKTPINACRIGWIERLEPDARYVHIVRNGISVARSVERLVLHPTYKMAFRPHYDQWWGERNIKWETLSREGPIRGYTPGEPELLTDHAQRGAYEWIASLGELDRARDTLGDRLLEITLTELTTDPRGTLGKLTDHLGLEPHDGWLATAASGIRAEAPPPEQQLTLPPAMLACFNAYQERFGFDGRAVLA